MPGYKRTSPSDGAQPQSHRAIQEAIADRAARKVNEQAQREILRLRDSIQTLAESMDVARLESEAKIESSVEALRDALKAQEGRSRDSVDEVWRSAQSALGASEAATQALRAETFRAMTKDAESREDAVRVLRSEIDGVRAQIDGVRAQIGGVQTGLQTQITESLAESRRIAYEAVGASEVRQGDALEKALTEQAQGMKKTLDAMSGAVEAAGDLCETAKRIAEDAAVSAESALAASRDACVAASISSDFWIPLSIVMPVTGFISALAPRSPAGDPVIEMAGVVGGMSTASMVLPACSLQCPPSERLMPVVSAKSSREFHALLTLTVHDSSGKKHLSMSSRAVGVSLMEIEGPAFLMREAELKSLRVSLTVEIDDTMNVTASGGAPAVLVTAVGFRTES